MSEIVFGFPGVTALIRMARAWDRARYRFLRWLIEDVGKTPPGMLTPRWALPFVWLVMPGQILCMLAARVYSPFTDTLNLNGVRISRRIIENMAKGNKPSNWFRWVKIDGYGIVTLEEMPQIQGLCGDDGEMFTLVQWAQVSRGLLEQVAAGGARAERAEELICMAFLKAVKNHVREMAEHMKGKQ